MRILILSPFVPDPAARGGAPRAIFDRVQILAERHDVTVLTLATTDEWLRRIALLALGVRVIGVGRPSSAADRPRDAWRKRARLLVGLLLEGRPMLATEFRSVRLERTLRGLLASEPWDALLVEHVLMGQYLPRRRARRPPRVVLTDHDVHAAFPPRPVPAAGDAGPVRRVLARLDAAAWRRLAGRAVRRADAVSVPTGDDAAVLERQVAGVPVHVVPFGLASAPHPVDEPAPDAQGRDADVLLFIGGFDHPPNVDAAQWLVADILPIVRRLRPETRTWLVGRGMPPSVRALAEPGVEVLGELPSVAGVLARCAVFVAPLRLGGGVRIKVLEALAAGAPVVTTSLGARGTGAEPGVDLLVADGTRPFAEAVVRALNDAGLRDTLEARGRRLGAGAARMERAASLERLLAMSRC